MPGARAGRRPRVAAGRRGHGARRGNRRHRRADGRRGGDRGRRQRGPRARGGRRCGRGARGQRRLPVPPGERRPARLGADQHESARPLRAAAGIVLPGAGAPMVADPILFRDLAYVFVAAVLGGALAWLARQPLIFGYVAGGLLVSPLTPGPSISDVHTFELFAEIGVVLLMFSIGIEFSLKDLMRVKWVAVLGGPLGIVLSIALGLATAAALGWSRLEGATGGWASAVASTMVLARLLIDRGELHSQHGRVVIGITLVEALAVGAL